ncbi:MULTISPECIES: serine hydrolase [Asticcacaulis]|uniref:serine hydrolase n=1 Tax=Asticcacaulis TaxID=76890 RepID=UPI001AE5782F|nr:MULTISPECIES: serine hydrolase [Asticcacaulis]MBP2161319.1 CubicO group peptidase (beta-lactamase class C family) [Asticcacaulis solisilvae]MDR6802315.1 CubicO group peptidase (beta-lactamase class C family) [Asticcacaulis sp. BE141]
MRFRSFLAVTAAFAALAFPAAAADNVQRMDEIIQSYVKSNQFMGSVLVARGDEIVLDKGYGYANLEWMIPGTPDTRYRLGSVTKQFTAAAILLLQENGKLKLSDPVKAWYPDAPATWDGITLRHLLTHTSGIPNFTGFPDYPTQNTLPTTPERTIARFRDRPLDFRPGEKMSYSNSGYVLLGHVIEKASGVPYARFVQDNIFTPLGMKDSGYDTFTSVIPKRASGYRMSPEGPVNAPYADMTIPFAAGGLYSTTHDLLKWENALFGGKLLKPESLQAMLTPSATSNYALGVEVDQSKGQRRITHSGSIEGFNTVLTHFPDEKLTIVVLGNVNGGAPSSIAENLTSVAHGETVVLKSERPAVSVAADVLQTYAGVYEVAPGFTLTVTVEAGQLVVQGSGQPKLPLAAVSQTRFYASAVDADIAFFKDGSGKVSHLVLYQGNREMTAKRK